MMQRINNRISRCRFSRGITLVELMLTLTIAAIVLMIAAPVFRDYVLNERNRAAARAIEQALRHARNQAITRGQNSVACPSSDQETCLDSSQWADGWLIFLDTSGDRERQAAEPLLRVGLPAPQVRATSSSFRQRLRFYPNGTAPASAATITVCNHPRAATVRRVILSNTGRIRTERLNPADTPGVCTE